MLIAEGSSDCYFLPGVLSRGLEKLIQDCPSHVDVQEVEQYSLYSIADHADLRRSLESDGGDYDLIFVHRDYRKADEWFHSFFRTLEPLGLRNVVKVIPVQTTEAWMLADGDALRVASGSSGLSDRQLGVPRRPSEVERIPAPKTLVQGLLPDTKSHYNLLAENIRLEQLEQVPSYQRWAQDTRAALSSLGFMR
ncbi:hypothetical protein F4553_003131 [Allocatelliglobosispora scoriae]|uniref:DUF4276 family protein n=1 Tax=Allocatelliglobosispora scoriae TaxID=643052 RepID=A0A841BSP0_9ACTN|nr:DUF4276 family protein [Allocatelliglobosispora scoriae]MBB5869752.1 hypothetical protein [Allocatelliglobosispora scoriae]